MENPALWILNNPHFWKRPYIRNKTPSQPSSAPSEAKGSEKNVRREIGEEQPFSKKIHYLNIYIYICVCVYVFKYIYIYTRVCVYVFKYIYRDIYI